MPMANYPYGFPNPEVTWYAAVALFRIWSCDYAPFFLVGQLEEAEMGHWNGIVLVETYGAP